MKPEFPTIDHDEMVSPHAQEVEFALILSGMINKVKEDPSQLRFAVYEFARARLEADAAWLEQQERQRLLQSLETAILGVEKFSAGRDERDRLQLPKPTAQLGFGGLSGRPLSTSLVEINEPNFVPNGVLLKEVYSRPEAPPIVDVQTHVRRSALVVFAFSVLIFGIVATLAIYGQELRVLRADLNSPSLAPSKLASPPQIPAAADAKGAATSPSPLPFPLPSDYGVYAVSKDGLSELQLLSEQVPDKRVSVSTPLSEASRTTLPDGKGKFVIYRRDLVADAPERIDVRVVARVMRAINFDAKGKPNFSPVSDAWNIRNFSYEFRVRPIAGNPEMLLVQPANPDFTLPAGRYALALKSQGYEFTVAGNITDPWQCLERTDAANGTFYSDCPGK